MEMLVGLVAGIIFGTILTLAGVIRYEKQVAAVLFKDMTIIKFMFSAAIVGAIGINLLNQLGLISLHLKPLALGAIVFGGILFGLGWALTGYCPGTAVAAIAEGRIHAIFAVIGMIIGSALFINLYPYVKPLIDLGNFGKLTIYQVANTSPFLIILLLTIAAGVLFYVFEKNRL
ncbi:MAG: DUF6691 family protein [bacterium]